MSEIARHWIDGEWVGSETVSEINDGFAEGGYKQSGTGRLRGPLAISDFQEAKTVVHAIPPFPGMTRTYYDDRIALLQQRNPPAQS